MVVEWHSGLIITKAHSFEEKYQAFLRILFQKPLDSLGDNYTLIDNYNEKEDDKWIWPDLTENELEEAIYKSSNKSAAGPDSINHLIIQNLYPILKEEIFELFFFLLKKGYYPKCWRKAIGIILAKPNRIATIPKSYRVISLLNCLGKVLEKIIATRLSYLYSISDSNILYYDQIGGKRQYSATDAAFSLVHDIEMARNEKLVSSALFIDIKGVYDHVSKRRLIQILIELNAPKLLIKWVICFMSERTVQLFFDGLKQEETNIEIGVL